MTDPNKFNPYPNEFTIKCPKCNNPAEFRFPFILYSENSECEARKSKWECSEVCRWGNWHVLQIDPNLFKWKDPSGGYSRSNFGIVRCDVCAVRIKHVLEWPQDAYFVIHHKDDCLWAWTMKHMQVLSSFIMSTERKPEKYAGFYLFLRHIPKTFLYVKNREQVVKKINNLIKNT